MREPELPKIPTYLLVMVDGREELFFCLEPMLFTPLYCLVGKGEDGPRVPKLREEANDAIVIYMIFFLFAMHLIDRIDVIVSFMIFCEPICFLKRLYRGRACMASHVHNGAHSSSVHGI